MNYGSWLRREIPKWVEDGLMTKEAGNTLLLRYKKGRISLYTGHVILLAVISLLVGLFFVLAGLWNGLTQDERFVAALAPVIISALLMIPLLRDERKYPKLRGNMADVEREGLVPMYSISMMVREMIAICHGISLIGAFWLVNDTFLLPHDWLYILGAEGICLIIIAYVTESAGLGVISMGIPVYIYYGLPETIGRGILVWILLFFTLPLLVKLLGVSRHQAVVAYSWVWTMAVLAIVGGASHLFWQTLFFSLAASLTWMAGSTLKHWGAASEILRLVGAAALFGVLLESSWGTVWKNTASHWFLWAIFFAILAINAVLLFSMWKEKKYIDVIAGLTPFAMLIASMVAVFETTGVASAIFMSSFAVFFAISFLVAGYVQDTVKWKILGILLLIVEAALRIFDSSLSYGERGLFFVVIALLLGILSVFSFSAGKWGRRKKNMAPPAVSAEKAKEEPMNTENTMSLPEDITDKEGENHET